MSFPCLALSFLDGVSPVRTRKIAKAFLDGVAFSESLLSSFFPEISSRTMCFRWDQACAKAQLAEKQIKAEGGFWIGYDDEAYPASLRSLLDAPLVLYVRGTLPSGPAMGIVGSRKASSCEQIKAWELAFQAADLGFTIISGLALGIDGAASQGALAAGGKTAVVLATPLDSIYPKAHETLAKNILKQKGCLLSEYPIGDETLPYKFVFRNRLISALSDSLCVVGSASVSGAWKTAEYALKQDKELFLYTDSDESSYLTKAKKYLRAKTHLVRHEWRIWELLKRYPQKIIKEPRALQSNSDDPVFEGFTFRRAQ